MTPKDFILEVIKAYQNARKIKYPHERLKRGRSHKVDSVTEDLFGKYLVENDGSIELIYIDQPISVESKTFYPDISIVRNGVISDFIEISTDLGYKRNELYNRCKKYKETILRVRGVNGNLRDGETKESRSLEISNSTSYSVVIISGTNINPGALDFQMEKVKALRPDVEVFILCRKGHPNTYGKSPNEVLNELDINFDEFTRLSKRLRL